MDSTYLTNPLVFLIEIIFGLYALIVLLRFLLQVVKADFFNPISQFVVKLTSPALNPMRRIIPGIGGIDVASLALVWLVITLQFLLIFAIKGQGLQLLASSLLAIPEIMELTINVFLFGIFIQVILSWISPGQYNPAIGVIQALTEPVLRPARRLIPPISGLDLSPMAVIIGLMLLKMILIPPVQSLVMQFI